MRPGAHVGHRTNGPFPTLSRWHSASGRRSPASGDRRCPRCGDAAACPTPQQGVVAATARARVDGAVGVRRGRLASALPGLLRGVLGCLAGLLLGVLGVVLAVRVVAALARVAGLVVRRAREVAGPVDAGVVGLDTVGGVGQVERRQGLDRARNRVLQEGGEGAEGGYRVDVGAADASARASRRGGFCWFPRWRARRRTGLHRWASAVLTAACSRGPPPLSGQARPAVPTAT